jgi:hypothetical protein
VAGGVARACGLAFMLGLIGIGQISALSGQFAAGYGLFAAGAGLALDDLAGTDERLSTRLRFYSVALQQIWF